MDELDEINHKVAGGSYIFRGEPECYPKVSSGLYRQYKEDYDERKDLDIEMEEFDVGLVGQEMLKEAERYTSEADEFEILAEIQHYGGKTNLIDFTYRLPSSSILRV